MIDPAECSVLCLLSVVAALVTTSRAGAAAAPEKPEPLAVRMTVEAEDIVLGSRYSNNGSTPMWCYGNTVLARIGDRVFISGVERVPRARPLSDCRWVLLQRVDGKWERVQTGSGLTREPSPLGVLGTDRLALSVNPVAGGGTEPRVLVFDPAKPAEASRTLRPAWRGRPRFSDHSYRSFVTDAATSEAILFQYTGYSQSEWSLLGADGKWTAGRLAWPPYRPGEMAPPGMNRVRVGYPVVVLRNRAVHLAGVGAYDNWDRVKTRADLGVSGESFSAARQRGNRMRRLLYTWTDRVGEKPFRDWIEIDNSFKDGGWLFAGDAHLDAEGTLHLLWTRCPMLPSVRDQHYKDIKREYRIEYATVRDGRVTGRRTLVTAPEPAVLTDPDQIGRPYVLLHGERILGDAIPTPRFHVAPGGRLFVVYYFAAPGRDGKPVSETRLFELKPGGVPTQHAVIPLEHPLCQFFTATPRAGNAPSWTLDLAGHRRGQWKPVEGKDYREWDGTLSYARVRIEPERTGADPKRRGH